MSSYGWKECCQIWKRSKSEHCQGLHRWLGTTWESRCRFLRRKAKQFHKTKFYHFGIHSSAFQAEVLAIPEVAKNLLLEKLHNQSNVVLMNSQAAIKSLIKCSVTLITVLNRIRNLNRLGKQNHVSIAWIPAHAGVHRNEVADYLTKSGSKSKIHGPEPFITVPYASCVSTVKDCSTDRWKSTWNKRKDCLRIMESVGWTSSRLTIRLLNLKRPQLNRVVQI